MRSTLFVLCCVLSACNVEATQHDNGDASSGDATPVPDAAPQPPFTALVGVHSGKCVDVHDSSTADGAEVFLWTCLGTANQQWMLVPMGDGTVSVVVHHSGKCLDLRGGQLENGAAIEQWTCLGNANQRWIVAQIDAGSFALLSAVSHRCVDVTGFGTADGSPIAMYDCQYTTNEAWHP